ncbi:hypothetical protein [Streptomyces sp. NPDC001401]|uniref:hypothetical protein n=1 Tax=Streptomyces sp. NPDC001401 TaxID=3364570 RepID=UPI00368B5EC1
MTSGGHHAPPTLSGPGSRGGPGQRTAAATVEQWQQPLKQLPAYAPGVHLTGRDREKYRAAVALSTVSRFGSVGDLVTSPA